LRSVHAALFRRRGCIGSKLAFSFSRSFISDSFHTNPTPAPRAWEARRIARDFSYLLLENPVLGPHLHGEVQHRDKIMRRDVAQGGAGVVGIRAAENQVTSKEFIQHGFIKDIAYEGGHFCVGTDFPNEPGSERDFHRSGFYREISITARMVALMIGTLEPSWINQHKLTQFGTGQ
jgi:hypothetical protein